ncbi:hypothetical protein AHMF7605_18810 [Adhaeribacter arboris]|uniref:Uncharacterized protein n=1 Tax=Adhaeribacter arboris TaxID=2072846 RepID=A0A2T2YIT7_9BACT|nr:hypothetical protein AHMF7605_18810 [Adhaeribacter arboris]
MRQPEKIANNLPKLSGLFVSLKFQKHTFKTLPEGALAIRLLSFTGRIALGRIPLTYIFYRLC